MKHAAKLALALLLATAAPPTIQAQPQAAAVDPEAMAALERMRAHLRSLRSFEVRAQTTIQEVIDDDIKVDLLHHVRYDYRAPDRLFADWQSDRQERRLYFDGRTATIFAPRVGYYASTQVPGTVAQMLRRAAEEQGIIFPLPDLFYWATQSAPAYDIQQASYVGPARVAGFDLDHYAFRQSDVDWQVWIERGARPLPRKIVITDRTDRARPSVTALLAWNPDAQLSDDRFVFTAPQGTRAIQAAASNQGSAR